MITATVLAPWVLARKMGLKGWEYYVPVYGPFKFLEALYGSGWWLLLGLLVFIPILGWLALLVLAIKVEVDFCHAFGYKGFWFMIGAILASWIFDLIIAYGDHPFRDGSMSTEGNDYISVAIDMIKDKLVEYKEKQNIDVKMPETAAPNVICPVCGAINAPEHNFCDVCGNKLK